MKHLYSALIVLLIFAGLLQADVKSTAIVTGTDKGTNVTLPAPFNMTVYAGTFKATINSSQTNLYCIDLNHSLAYNEPYQDVASTDSLMTYVLNNYYPYKPYPYAGSLSTVEKEAAAVQLCMWKLADGLNLNGVTGVDTAVRNRAIAIYNDAVAHAHTLSLNSFFIDIPVQSFAIGNPITFTVKAFDNMGIAMPNVSITLSTSSGTLSTTTVTTNSMGVSPVVTLTPAVGGTTATITATGTVGIPAGTKYYHVANPNGKQKLILATPTIAQRTINRTVTWYNQIELVVTKVADKTTVNNGDFINYTIKVKNIGTSNASNVLVSDMLPAILQYVSSTPSGQYDNNTGIWNAGNLNVGDSATIVIKTKVNYSNPNAAAYTLGAAAPYNFYVTDTLIQPSADTEGKLAVGDYADLRGYSVGDKLPAGSGDVLVVGNHLTFITGRVYNGRAVYQNYITSTMGFSADSGIVQDSVHNFPATKTYLRNLSTTLSTLALTDTARYEWGQVVLRGNKTTLNVFNVSGNQLKSMNSFLIDCPAGSSVLVNISGDTTRLFGGFEVVGTTKDKVMLNFYQAKKLTISGIDVRASVLAPFAFLDFPAGIVTGQLIVRSMYGSGQVNLCPFTGTITPDTTVVNVATVLSAGQGNNPGFFIAPNAMAKVSTTNGVTGIKTGSMPQGFGLEQNYPNPFNPETVIRFTVEKAGSVTLNVYNMTGELVATLLSGTMEAGTHTVSFKANTLPSGIYLARLQSGTNIATKKMILQK